MSQFSNLRRADADAPVNVVVDVAPVVEPVVVSEQVAVEAPKKTGRVTLVLDEVDFIRFGRRCSGLRTSKQEYLRQLLLSDLDKHQA
ncbi:hypothetical protein [Quatrionicoccus australiensis]|uniref:hypothetical protein n=1 Tax=Quatrionicoccus australiensis TaxID=138118 RepID=UPI001CFC31A4|nr:hypothetical protein [Quatrionicoccus australiensis]MCB4359558.1 hypothetical protein [Quatrionicoccus australiensis]